MSDRCPTIAVDLTIERDREPVAVRVTVELATAGRLRPDPTGRDSTGADYHLTTTEIDWARRAAAETLRRCRLH